MTAFLIFVGMLLLISAGWSFLGALIFSWAWGLVLVPLFGLPPVSLWQAFAVLVLLQFVRAVVNTKVEVKRS